MTGKREGDRISNISYFTKSGGEESKGNGEGERKGKAHYGGPLSSFLGRKGDKGGKEIEGGRKKKGEGKGKDVTDNVNFISIKPEGQEGKRKERGKERRKGGGSGEILFYQKLY